MSTPDSAPDSTPNSAPPELLSLRSLATAIGVDAGQLSKESRRPGFPGHPVDGVIFYSADEVTRWRQANVRRKKSRPETPGPAMPAAAPRIVDRPSPSPAMPPGQPAPSGPASPAPALVDPKPVSSKLEQADARRQRDRANDELTNDADGDLLEVLQSGKSSALEISKATVQIAARRLARAHIGKILGPNDLDGLKKALQELRTAESDYIDLGKAQRELIARDEVRLILTECCGRLVRVLNGLENSIVTEFSVWLADPKLASMGADERARLIRDFVAKSTRSARTQEADEIEQLINQPRSAD